MCQKKKDVYDLIEDSKLFFDFIDFKDGINILDIGTGGGFPGIILKLNYPLIKLTLVDSIKKKIIALSNIVSNLRLTDVIIICSRAEELTKKSEFYRQYDYITAMSVAPQYKLSQWSEGLLKKDGKLIALKGGNIEEEIFITKTKKFIKNINIFEKNSKKIVEVIFNA